MGNNGSQELRVLRVIKILVSAVYLLAPLAIFIYKTMMESPMDSTYPVLVIFFSIASAYVIFGEKIIDEIDGTAPRIRSNGRDRDG